jgi:2-polyprenyl-3-methyl-5-hydroxy-6-metoxy-1,4-benzoquinol methylase
MTKRTDDGFDRTYLRANREGYRVHRDYAAHYFRWGWAVSRAGGIGIAGKTVLDVGCGQDVPLLRVATYTSQQPAYYVGVDLNHLPELSASEEKRAELFSETNFINIASALADRNDGFDVVVAFESLEHMPRDAAWQTLWWMRKLTKSDGFALVSTPVFNGQQASNHIHEFTVDDLRALIEAAGFTVERRYGTFASYHAVMRGVHELADREGLDTKLFDRIYTELKEYYADDVLATFVAPLLPDHSRNNVWKLRP